MNSITYMQKRRSYGFNPVWTVLDFQSLFKTSISAITKYKYAYLHKSLRFASCNRKETCPQRPHTIERTIQKCRFGLKPMRFKKRYIFLCNVD